MLKERKASSLLAIWNKIHEIRTASEGQIRSFRAVAQLGRAPGSGPGGRGFKSHQPDFKQSVSVERSPRRQPAGASRGPIAAVLMWRALPLRIGLSLHFVRFW